MRFSTPHQLFLGTFVHCATKQDLEFLHDTAVFVDGPSGRIAAIERDCDLNRAQGEVFPRLGWRDDAGNGSGGGGRPVQMMKASEGRQFFFPGFIDTHIHAPQYPNAGIFGSTTLLDWLAKYTFPLEASLGDDLAKARRVYGAVVRRTLAHGTTAASYYATRDVAATNILADTCARLGQRAYVGRVNMDRESTCPDFYRDESAEAALEDTRRTIEYVRRKQLEEKGEERNGEREKEEKESDEDEARGMALVTPIITPRFAPSCTDRLLAHLGTLAGEANLPIQTHISENLSEINLMHSLFGDRYPSYAAVYDGYSLLTPRTILAHAIWLSDSEASLIAARGAKVSHCPCSNTSLSSGVARVRWLWEKGIVVGLGTDISGGYSPSVLESARQASLVSRYVSFSGPKGGDAARSEGGTGKDKERAKLSVEEVLWLATRGGAEVMGLEERVGRFEVGMEWDAQLVGMAGVGADGGREHEVEGDAEGGDEGNVVLFGWESWEDIVAKWVFGGDDRNTKMVWVKGRLVHSRRWTGAK